MPVNCTEITLGDFQSEGGDGTQSAFIAVSSPNMGDTADLDHMKVEFYGSQFEAGYDGEQTGTFDLTADGDDNFATCSRCVLLFVDPDDAVPGKTFYQSSGTLVLDAGSDQIDGAISGTFTDLTLVEVTIGSDYTSTPVPGGACLHLASASAVAMAPPPPSDAGAPTDAGSDAAP